MAKTLFWPWEATEHGLHVLGGSPLHGQAQKLFLGRKSRCMGHRICQVKMPTSKRSGWLWQGWTQRGWQGGWLVGAPAESGQAALWESGKGHLV